MSLKSSFLAKSLSAFVILAGWWFAGFKYLTVLHLKHSLSSIFLILINPFLRWSNSLLQKERPGFYVKFFYVILQNLLSSFLTTWFGFLLLSKTAFNESITQLHLFQFGKFHDLCHCMFMCTEKKNWSKVPGALFNGKFLRWKSAKEVLYVKCFILLCLRLWHLKKCDHMLK